MRNLYIYFLILILFSTLTSNAQLTIGANGLLHIATPSGGTLGSYDNTNASVALFVDANIVINN